MADGVNATPVRQDRRGTHARWKGVLAAVMVATLAACGGGKEDSSSSSADNLERDASYPAPTGTNAPADKNAAARFLTQASFGPTDASVQRVMDIGYSQWIDDQFTKTPSRHRATWESLDAATKAINASDSIGANGVPYSFWRSALAGNDQLRQRVAFALSQIFVVSMVEPAVGDNPRAAADYLDMLSTKGLTSYRELIEAVTLHPMMGRYLSSLGNRKADAATGRVPDENYAREVMQLFSIGLYELNLDGSRRLNAGNPIETYTPADIAGMAKVFTGWSWACPVAPTATNSSCFSSGSSNGQSDPERMYKPMIAYPQQHSAEAKQFLGQSVGAGATPAASLKKALDTLATHANTAPFISKQLIQRLVTSNPTPGYVQRVATVFNNTDGDMKAVVKAILLDSEARTPGANGGNVGKVREPLLRLSAAMRAFGYTSDSGWYKLGNTDDPASAIGQTVLRAPSVFNYYRPGYVAPGSQAAGLNLVAPEMQLVHETSAAGYVSYMREVVAGGIGQNNAAPYNRRDLQPNFTAELALATDPAALVDQVERKLMYGTMPPALKTLIVDAVAGTQMRRVGVNGATQANVDADKRTRVNAAVFFTVVSPEFLVQK